MALRWGRSAADRRQPRYIVVKAFGCSVFFFCCCCLFFLTLIYWLSGRRTLSIVIITPTVAEWEMGPEDIHLNGQLKKKKEKETYRCHSESGDLLLVPWWETIFLIIAWPFAFIWAIKTPRFSYKGGRLLKKKKKKRVMGFLYPFYMTQS